MKNLKQAGWLAASAALVLWATMCYAQSGAYPQSHEPTMGPGQNGSMNDAQMNPQMGTAGAQADDKTFMKKAAEGGMAEVQLGQLAQQNAQSQEVKDFGQRMVTDHTKANDQLKQVAEQQKVTLPAAPSSHDQAEYNKMSKLHGEAFDKAYAKMMVADHRKDIAEFKQEASSGRDPAVKNFASQTLPTLQEHLQLAEKMNKDEKSGGSSGAGNGSSSQ